MTTLVGGKTISVIGAGSRGSATAHSITSELSELLGELNPKDIDIVWNFLDVCHGAIVLKEDDEIDDALIVDAGRGVLKFPSGLVQYLRKKHGDAADSKIRDMLRPLVKGIVKQATDHSERSIANIKEQLQLCEERKADRERQGLASLQTEPMHLIAELTKRVEQLEARR